MRKLALLFILATTLSHADEPKRYIFFVRPIQQKDMDYVNSLQLPGKTLQPGDMLPKDQQSEGEEGHARADDQRNVKRMCAVEDPPRKNRRDRREEKAAKILDGADGSNEMCRRGDLD